MTRKKRVPKPGLVYLLQSDCGEYAKYGASSDMKNRLRHINRTNPFGAKFYIANTYSTKDMFALENKIKWLFVDNRICMHEYFILAESDIPFIAITSILEVLCQKDG